MHDNFDDDNYQNTITKLERRIERFHLYLLKNKSIIFLRLEQNNNGRIIYDEYTEQFNKSEYDYLIELSLLLKTKYDIRFKIIFIGNNSTKYDNDIICIKSDVSLLS